MTEDALETTPGDQIRRATTGSRSRPERRPPPTATARVDLDDSSLYFNRELSWLDFNERVLQLAEDPSVPLLERLKFCAIYEDNLDEFYMVRVAGLHDQVEAELDARGADGIAPSEVIGRDPRARDRAARARCSAASTRSCVPALSEHGIRLITLADANAGRARGAREDLHGTGLPGADAAGDRAGQALPLHLQPLAQHRGAAAQPREGRGGDGPGQGPEGAAAPLPRDRRRAHLRARSRR